MARRALLVQTQGEPDAQPQAGWGTCTCTCRPQGLWGHPAEARRLQPTPTCSRQGAPCLLSLTFTHLCAALPAWHVLPAAAAAMCTQTVAKLPRWAKPTPLPWWEKKPTNWNRNMDRRIGNKFQYQNGNGR